MILLIDGVGISLNGLKVVVLNLIGTNIQQDLFIIIVAWKNGTWNYGTGYSNYLGKPSWYAPGHWKTEHDALVFLLGMLLDIGKLNMML